MAEAKEEQSVALVTIEQSTAMDVFKDGEQIKAIVKRIRDIAETEVLDASTPVGRAAIKALAYKIKRSKTYLDGIGKELVDDLKDIPRKIDASRKIARDELDKLHDEIRKPLTDYEAEQARIEAEKAAEAEALRQRVARISEDILAFNNAPMALIGKPYSVIKSALDDLINRCPIGTDFDSRIGEATAAWQAAVTAIEALAEQAKALEEQKQAERDREIIEKTKAAEREAADRRILQARIEAERAEREREEAEQRAATAERQRQEAEDNAAREREAAIKREEQARIESAEQERQRQKAIERAAQEEQARRDADKEHLKKINNQAVADLMEHCNLNVDQSKAVVLAIFKNHISNITIKY